MLIIIVVIIRIVFELKKGRNWMIMVFVSLGVVICMNIFWDIVIDWGFFCRYFKNFYLRDKFFVFYKSVYFVVMVNIKEFYIG